MKGKQDGEGRLNVRLSRDFLRRVKVECAKRGTTMQAATQEALERWLRAKP
jgi:predicted DNA binding CopG/RHH family protein